MNTKQESNGNLIIIRSSESPQSPDYYSVNTPKKGKGKNTKNAKNTKKGKKANEKPVHMYSPYGIMQMDEESGSSAKMSARAQRFAKDRKFYSNINNNFKWS
jgi:hypothetical protein